MHTPRHRLARPMTIALVAMAFLLTTTSSSLAITKDEVITLTKLKISPSEIIKAIEKDKTIFDLSVTDILALKKAAVDEKVLKFMLATPQKFGKKATGASPDAGGGPAAEAEKEETPEEKAAREERLRQEALRMKAEQKKAEEAQRKAYAQGVLAKGRRLAEDGEWIQSIKAFQRFKDQGNYTDDSEEAYLAKFGITNALVKAGLYQSAANRLWDLVLAGPERPFFKTAFEQVRELRRKVDVDLFMEDLTAFAVTDFSRTFQDQFNYVLGEWYFEYNAWDQSRLYLDQVSTEAPDYGKSKYLMGLIEVREALPLKSDRDIFLQMVLERAVPNFQQAILATEENESNPEVKDLAFLALARIAYEVGNYDAAIYYYRKVPSGSAKSAEAFYESAWVYFQKGDYSRAIGTFHTLHSPYFSHQFLPELWILEATAYLNLCHFDLAEKALDRYEADIAPVGTPLSKFLQTTVRPTDYYYAIVHTVAGQERYNLPPQAVSPVLGNVEFYNLYKTIRQVEQEQSLVSENLNQLGQVGDELDQLLGDVHANLVRKIGIKIQYILRETEAALLQYGQKLTEIRVDLTDQQIEEEERQLMALEMGEQQVEEEVADTGGSTAIVGASQWQWGFEGEYWKEEIGTYRAFIKNQCVREELP